MTTVNLSFPTTFALLASILSITVNGYVAKDSSQEFQGINSSSPLISLRQFNIHEDAVTLSGFSSGASMATQLHVAHSSMFHGVALFSQVFYRCGASSLIEFGLRCSQIGLGIFPYDVNRSLRDVDDYESQELIDPLRNLGNQRIFIWTGSLDEYVPPEMAVKNVNFYENFLTSPNSSIQLKIFTAKHLFPTTNFGAACNEDASENVFLGNCNYSGAYHSLEFLLRDKTRLTYPQDPVTVELSTLNLYNQSEFYPDGDIKDVGMGTAGFVYIPQRCQESGTKCFLHLNFHGCNEWPPSIAEMYIRNSGYLPVAEVNNIILVFPLTTRTPENMNGCWDFFSYTGHNFATKEGAQIKVARQIIQRILRGN